MMDTFFFIHVELIDGQIFRYGPYTSPQAAAEVMVDSLPSVLSAELNIQKSPKYKASISEWIINDGSWEKIMTKVTEDRRN